LSSSSLTSGSILLPPSSYPLNSNSSTMSSSVTSPPPNQPAFLSPSSLLMNSHSDQQSQTHSRGIPFISSDVEMRDFKPTGLQKRNQVPLYMQHVITVDKFSRNELHSIFSVAHEMRTLVERDGAIDLLRGKVLCNLFYEPSTRTSCSFETAMKRLGGEVVSIATSTSSVAKGESLADTIRVVDKYANVIVLRHPGVGSAEEAAHFSSVPVINAGDGIGEHPTQALLDIYTIREELGTVNGLDIAIVGDLKHGRTTHSLVKLLSLYNVRLHYVAPPSLKMPQDIKDRIAQTKVPQREYQNIEDVITFADVLYMTRIQKERFERDDDYKTVSRPYVLDAAMMNKAKTNMVVLHPLPRIDEIQPEVDLDPRAAYFRQMRYGLFVRMALLSIVLGKA